jgi:hypothetical protein
MKRDLTERISSRIIESNWIKNITALLDRFLQGCFRTSAMRRLKIFLNGTWVGHPLHPALTDVSIGAWTLAIVLDLIGLLFQLPQLGLAAGIAIGVGWELWPLLRPGSWIGWKLILQKKLSALFMPP